MSLPTHPCGCEGTFTVTYSYYGGNYNTSVRGYENDQPYLKNIGNLAYLWSNCRDGDMRGGQVWSGANETQILSISFTKDDPTCGTGDPPPNKKYDCLNGECIEASVYATDGKYNSLEECQTACGSTSNSCPAPLQCLDPVNYCPPGKVCISSVEWSQIEGLSSSIKNSSC